MRLNLLVTIGNFIGSALSFLLSHGTLADNLNRYGIVCCFLSFWAAAPEILGEDRMHRFGAITRLMSRRLAAGFDRFSTFLFETTIGKICSLVIGTVTAGLVMSKVDGLLAPIIIVYGSVAVFGLTTAIVVWLLPLLARRLAANRGFRRRLLSAGAILFVVGSALQLVSTYVG